MDYYLLDKVSWQHSQSLYHAAAHLGRPACFILRPAEPYICIGCHQDAHQVIDMEYADSRNIPVFRRQVGGGAVFLDGNQLFYQLILPSSHPQVPARKQAFYQKFLTPVVETFREFGVAAEYKSVNDIIVDHRKISGNGAAEINDMVVLVGNFILDFDFKTMSRCLRVPDEKFRDKVYKTLTENLTTMQIEIDQVPTTEALGMALVKRLELLLGEGTIHRQVDEALLHKANALFAEMNTPEWLLENDRRRPDPGVKIREGVYVIRNAYKSPGGLIQIEAVKVDGRLENVHISGDFFFYPASDLHQLESALIGISADSESVTTAIDAFYRAHAIEAPGVRPEDFSHAITNKS
ncbi:MAG: lipoate protein ligase C-terminal domain-containing protein [Anaerolineales bacterium]